MRPDLASAMTPLILAAALGAAAPSFAQAIDAPVPHVGDVREYQTTDDWTSQVRHEERQEVVGVLSGFVRMRTEQKTFNLRTNRLEPQPTEEDTQRADLNVDFASRSGSTRRVNFDWPLRTGKKWHYDYDYGTVDNSGAPVTVRMRVDAQVEGPESVSTPAGTFRAIKVVHQASAENTALPGIAAHMGWTLWYSSEVGSLVKSTYQYDSATGTPGTRSTTLLMSFKRGAP